MMVVSVWVVPEEVAADTFAQHVLELLALRLHKLILLHPEVLPMKQILYWRPIRVLQQALTVQTVAMELFKFVLQDLLVYQLQLTSWQTLAQITLHLGG
jgi:hypothetical protein